MMSKIGISEILNDYLLGLEINFSGWHAAAAYACSVRIRLTQPGYAGVLA